VDANSFEIGVIELFYPDLAAAKTFYEEVLSLAVDREDETSVSFVIGELVVILLNAEAAAELVEPVPVAAATGAWACFTIAVADLDAVCKEFAERGITPVNGPVHRPWGPLAAYFADPGGYIYEFVQISDDQQES
jgi:lactoylglutathione lyase